MWGWIGWNQKGICERRPSLGQLKIMVWKCYPKISKCIQVTSRYV